MTADLPERAAQAFETHDAFERIDAEGTENDGRKARDDDNRHRDSDDRHGDGDPAWFAVTTTRFDGRVTADETDDWEIEYTLEVRTPMLSTATAEDVGPAVEEGWFETFELRLADAPMAVPHDVDLKAHRVFEESGDAVAVFTFRWGNADQAPDIAKAIAEYVEGTYVEGIVPGYEYGPPVSELLSRASHSDEESGRGPMPL